MHASLRILLFLLPLFLLLLSSSSSCLLPQFSFCSTYFLLNPPLTILILLSSSSSFLLPQFSFWSSSPLAPHPSNPPLFIHSSTSKHTSDEHNTTEWALTHPPTAQVLRWAARGQQALLVPRWRHMYVWPVHSDLQTDLTSMLTTAVSDLRWPQSSATTSMT